MSCSILTFLDYHHEIKLTRGTKGLGQASLMIFSVSADTESTESQLTEKSAAAPRPSRVSNNNKEKVSLIAALVVSAENGEIVRSKTL